jgi:hypothetical protein
VAAIASTVGASRQARAASGRVALARPAATDPTVAEAVNRIRGELVAEGFDVVLVDAPPSTDPAGAPPADPTAIATIGLAVDKDTHVAELRVVDRLTNKVVIRRTPVDDAGSGHAAEVLAVRAVELLRASLLELLVAPRPARAAAPPEVRQATAWVAKALPMEPDPAWAVEVGAAVLGEVGDVPPAILAMARGRRRLFGALDLRATVAGLGTTPRVTKDVGNATVTQAFGMVEAVGVFWARAPVHPTVSLGAGALYVGVDGHPASASAPFRGRSDSLWAFVGDAGVGAAVRLERHFELTFEGHAMLATPQPTITFAGSDVGRVGLPSLLGSLSIAGWL